jgi:hypothetical protein
MMKYTRAELEGLKRADLQKVCKDYGVKANLKSEALIGLILDASPLPAPTRCTSTRQSSRTSTRTSSRKPSVRISSAIIHDVEDKEDGENANTHLQPSTRTRKAKDTQKRLGVGKPRIAGGSGARSLTRASSPSKGRRSRSSRNGITTIREG